MPDSGGLDRFAIGARYAFKWHLCVLYAIGVILVLGPRFDLDGLRHRVRRLEWSASFASDPLVQQEAQRRLAVIRQSWTYRGRHAIRFGPTLLALVVIVPALGAMRKATRAWQWAQKGRCMGCGYDLRGSGVRRRCPECDTPPAPLKVDSKRPGWGRHRRLGIGLLLFAAFAAYFVATTGPSRRTLVGTWHQRKVVRAFDEAPRLLARLARVVDAQGTTQYACMLERATGLKREEWWKDGALDDAIVVPVDGGFERYNPSSRVSRQRLAMLPARRKDAFEVFRQLEVDGIAGAMWYETERVWTGDGYEVYRRFESAGLHEHHARDRCRGDRDIDAPAAVLLERAVFTEQLAPDAIPPLERLAVTEISYPDSVGPEMRGLDTATPGLLRKEFAVTPAWLDAAWFHPVRGD